MEDDAIDVPAARQPAAVGADCGARRAAGQLDAQDFTAFRAVEQHDFPV